MFNFFENLFTAPAPKKQKLKREDEAKLVALYSKGNPHLQNGQYLKESDIDAMREHEFSN